ncbi:MAG TPA: PIN domain nuclease [Actinomycetota bacterium]|nr:PIN domain nuclease [Actinomycetota bacterium]
MGLILDAGAFVAVERGDREIAALVKRERLAGRSPTTHGGVVGQVWRGGAGRQAMVARLLAGMEVRSLDADLGKRAGVLLGLSGGADVVDAALVCLAVDGDEILTSDPEDLVELARNAGVHVDLIAMH